MEQNTHTSKKLSPRRIAGFACNQGFVFFLFYMGLNRSFSFGPFSFERADLIVTLFFMAVGFLVINIVSTNTKKVLTARPIMLLYAFLFASGSLIPYITGVQGNVGWLLLEGGCIGISCSLLLVSWGRAFGEVPTKISIPEVFIGSLLGALFGLGVSFVPIPRTDLVFRILPFVSAIALMVGSQPGFGLVSSRNFDNDSKQSAALLSLKVLAGTALFGMAAGLMETFNTDPGMQAMPSYAIAFLLFAAFAVGVLSLLLSDGFGRGASLNKAYRIAILVLLTGFILVPAPFFAGSIVSGEAIVLAGYLSLSAVLISLFLVLASITGISSLSSFSRGFAALFGGELLGVIVANCLNSTQVEFATPYTVVVLAAVLVMFSYIFLFTERDFDNLSEMVTDKDSFENRCEAIIEKYGLSSREAEILPFVLKGRTSERISQELFISKSTVDTHLRRIYGKVDVHSRQELIDISEKTSIKY